RVFSVALTFSLLVLGGDLHAQQEAIKVSALTDGVYRHQSFKQFKVVRYSSNGLVLDTDSGVVIIDTPWTEHQSAQLLVWIAENLKKPVIMAVVTHAHDDRMAGAEALMARGVAVYGLAETIVRAPEKGLAPPNHALPADTVFQVGQHQFRTYFPGAGHAPDNLVVWLPSQKVLFGGCLVKSARATNLGNIADADLAAWPVAIRRLQNVFSEAETVVPGHGQPSGPEALANTLKLLAAKDAQK
ncbi:MAG: subclass B1 metallo-beta-lactamase, partial [Bacteroidota bacterium]